MKHAKLFSVILMMFLALLLPVSAGTSQDNDNPPDKQVNVKVVTSENGETTTVDKVYTTPSGADITAILQQLGVVDELGSLAEDEIVEITIRRKKDASTVRDMTIELDAVAGMPPAPAVKKQQHGFLGVYIGAVSKALADKHTLANTNGAHIQSIIPNSGAAASDLQAGDIVTAVNDQPITSYQQLIKVIRSFAPEDNVTIGFVRDGRSMTTEATLGVKKHRERRIHRPSRFDREAWHKRQSQRAFFGVSGGTHFNEQTSEKDGAHIKRVIPNTSAAEMGIEQNDVVTAINGVSIKSFSELHKLLKTIKPGSQITVDYLRDGNQQQASGTIKSRADHRSRGVISHPREIREKLRPHGLVLPHDLNATEQSPAIRFTPQSDENSFHQQHIPGAGHAEVVREVTFTISLADISDAEAQEFNKRSNNTLPSDNDLAHSGLSVYPNPNKGVFKLNFNLPESGETLVRIYDAQGHEIYFETLNGFSGLFEREINISDKAAGVYYLTVRQDNNAFTKKIIVE